jgi:membrane associated rhomboid family serine protease
LRQRADGWNGVLGFVAVLALMAVLQQRHAFGIDWFAVGKTHAGGIRQGEWWRTVTALTLHADLEHVLSNLVIGGLVGLFAGQSLGSGLAWCSILIAGALGNFLNAWVHAAEHTSVGASTAVFAALGLLAAHAWWQRRTLRTARLERWGPIVGGVVLLSFLGTGGGRTDVAAHVFGFLCATPFGVLCGKPGVGAMSSPRTQFLLGLTALTILAVAWALALMPPASWRGG